MLAADCVLPRSVCNYILAVVLNSKHANASTPEVWDDMGRITQIREHYRYEIKQSGTKKTFLQTSPKAKSQVLIEFEFDFSLPWRMFSVSMEKLISYY